MTALLSLRQCFLLAGLVALLSAGSYSPAGSKDGKDKDGKDSGKVKVTLVVILAGEDRKEVDPALQQIAEEVRKLNPQLTGFRLHSMTNRSLTENEKSVFPLVDGKKAEVIVMHGADDDNRVSLSVTPPEQGEIIYRSVCGKFLPIVTRYQTKSRDRLIFALRVEPCLKK